MPLSLSAMHMSNVKTYEVQRTNHFEVILDGFGDEFTLSVESIPLPTVSNDPIELAYGNSKVKVAGQATFEDIEIVVKDMIGADMEAKLDAWRRQVYNPETDQVGWAANYKRNGRIHQYAPDGTYDRTWRIVGAWPTNMTPGDMAYDGGDKKTISMTLSVDKAYILR